MYRYLFSIIISLASIQVHANIDVNFRCKTALHAVFSLQFDKAALLLEQEKKENPLNAFPAYIENYKACINVIIDEQPLDFEQLKKDKAVRLQRLDAYPVGPYYRYCKAEIYLQCAFARIKFNEYITAALEINKAYKLLSENEKLYPQFALNKKTLGLLHALIGTVPDEYQWACNMMGFSGTVGQGAAELRKTYLVVKTDTAMACFIPELLFMRSFTEGSLTGNKTEMANLCKQLLAEDPSPLLSFAYASLSRKLGKNDAAIDHLKTNRFANGYHTFHYLDLQLGEALLHKLDPDAAASLLDYVNNFGGSNYLKCAYLRLYWHALIFGNAAQQKKYYTLLKEKGQAVMDEDKQALKELSENPAPAMPLLKARLLFDGAYFSQALAQLSTVTKKDIPGTRDQLEYIYRLGRIYSGLEQHEKALHYYRQVIKTGEQQPYYFAASAALQMALHAEAKKDTVDAIVYYKKCLSLKNHAYKNSLGQKAKAGISRLKRP